MTSAEPTSQGESAAMVASQDTPILQADEPAAILLAGRCLREGGLVVVPTETFYGIAALPDDARALKRLTVLKSRSKGKALTLLAADKKAVRACASLTGTMEMLAEAFWPGALTLVLPIDADLDASLVTSPRVSGAPHTVALRVSEHPVARGLAREVGGLITGTSANCAGEPPPRSIAELDPKILAAVDMVIDAGALPGGLPSTLVGPSQEGLIVYRAGALSTKVLLEQVLGPDMSVG